MMSEALILFNESPGIPSTKISGEPPFTEGTPRIFIDAVLVGLPEAVWIFTDGSAP